VEPDDPGSEEHDQPEDEEEDIIPSAVPLTNQLSGLYDYLLVSKSCQLFMNVQFTVILFIAFFWL
jgi:hypothetical protein